MDNIAGSGCDVLVPFNERLSLDEIEKNIIKKYRRKLWSKFTKAIVEFNLVEPGDKIAIAISGGKDSLLMAKLFQELKRHRKFDFDLEFIAMDPGYHPHIRELLIDNCKYLNIPVTIYESQIFNIIDNVSQEYPCYLCAKMRRGSLYAKAQELGCNKLALGHHFNDVIETILLNVLCSGNFKTMLPKLKATHFENMELIRPLYYIDEADIQEFTQTSGILPLNCACMVAAKKIGSKRYEIKNLINNMKENFSDVDKSIFKASQNVHLDSILGWKKDGKDYSYLDFYDL